MIKNTIEITKDEFNSTPNNYLEMIENNEVKKIIIQDEKDGSSILTSYSNYYKERERCCHTGANKWDTIGFFAVIIVVIISVNFGTR